MPPEEWQDRADALYDPVFRADNISRLCNTIRRSFRSVRASLLAFDYERFVDQYGDVLQLLPKWDVLSSVSDFRPS
jgi:hypothetical protein